MYEALTKREAQRWAEMTITPSRRAGLVATARRVLAHKDTYETVEAKLRSMHLYVPWWAVGVIHLREADLNFNCQLSQGDPLASVSHHEPRGRGPFTGPDAFLRGCLDALVDCAPHAAHWADWSPGGSAVLFELYNGLGYANKGVPSPYNWGGSDQYVRGKYVSDGVYSPTFVDPQPGCMVILKCMMEIDPTIHFGGPRYPMPSYAPNPPDKPVGTVVVSPVYPQAPKVPTAESVAARLWGRLVGPFHGAA